MSIASNIKQGLSQAKVPVAGMGEFKIESFAAPHQRDEQVVSDEAARVKEAERLRELSKREFEKFGPSLIFQKSRNPSCWFRQ